MGDFWLILAGGVVAAVLGLAAVRALRLAHFKYIKLKRSRAFQKKTRKYRYWFPAFILGLLLFPVIIYLLKFYSYPISSTAAEWGQMGDFFGGMLNPILAFASFIALLSTIRIQSEELRLTREEFTKSSKAQQELADTAQDELALAKVSYQSQRELQFALPFFEICQQRIKNCEEILERLATVNGETFDDRMKWADFIVVFAKKESPLTYKHQTSEFHLVATRNKEFIEESLRVLQHINNEFQDAWNAIESVDSIIESGESQKMNHRMIGFVVSRLARIAYILHITDVRKFSSEVQDYWHKQNDYLMDEFRSHLKRIYDTA